MTSAPSDNMFCVGDSAIRRLKEIHSQPFSENIKLVDDGSKAEFEAAFHLKEIEDLAKNGYIMEARRLVDSATKISKSFATHAVAADVIDQSNHVTKMLQDLHSDTGWTLARKKRGVTVHYRHEEGSPIHTVRTHMVFDDFSPQDFVRLCSLFIETDLQPQWFPGGLMKSNEAIAKPSKFAQICHMKLSFGRFSPLSPRDAVVLGNGYQISSENAFLISVKSVEESRHCKIPPPNPGYVRMESEAVFYMQLLSHNKIAFSFISHDDLKIRFMPSVLLNYISQGSVPFEMVETIRDTVRNYGGSVWEERIKLRRSYYGEIESRMQAQIETCRDEMPQESSSPSRHAGSKKEKNVQNKRIVTSRQPKKNCSQGRATEGLAKISPPFYSMVGGIGCLALWGWANVTGTCKEGGWFLFQVLMACSAMEMLQSKFYALNGSDQNVLKQTSTTPATPSGTRGTTRPKSPTGKESVPKKGAVPTSRPEGTNARESVEEGGNEQSEQPQLRRRKMKLVPAKLRAFVRRRKRTRT